MELYLLIPLVLSIITLAFFLYPLIRKDKTKNTSSLLFSFLRYFRWALYIILFAFIVSFYFLIGLKVHWYQTQNSEFVYEDLVSEFDTTGLSIGLLGILVGLVTVYFVEKQNISKEEDAVKRNEEFQKAINALRTATIENENATQKRDDEFQKAIDALSKVTVDNAQAALTRDEDFQQSLQALSNATASVKASITWLNEVKTVRELIDGVGGLFDMSMKGNHVYMLTHLTSFGQLLIRNAEIICSNAAGENCELTEEDLSAKTFHKKYMKLLFDKKQLLDEKIDSFIVSNKLHVGVLSNKELSPEKVDKMRPFIEERILNGKLSVVIDPNSVSKIEFGKYTKENVFIHPSMTNHQENLTNAQQKEILVDDIINNDLNLIHGLKSTNRQNVEFETLDYVPFQFFLSVPKEERSDYGWRAIIIYSNYYNLGYDGSVVSFVTENATMCRGLKNMWRKLVIAQKEKDKRQNPVKKLFSDCNEIVLCLKNIEVPDREVSDSIGYQCVTPVPDILGKDYMIALLKSYEVRYRSAAHYIKNTETGNLRMLIRKETGTLFSLGIFYNPLTMFLSQQTPQTGNSFFRLVQKENSSFKNKVYIACGGTRNEPKYLEFVESFTEDDPDSCDYAFFARLKMSGNWIYVGGGLNYYGSEKLHTCIEEGVSGIADKVERKEFIVVFSLVKKDDAPVVKRILFSSIGNNGEIIGEYNNDDVPDVTLHTYEDLL